MVLPVLIAVPLVAIFFRLGPQALGETIYEVGTGTVAEEVVGSISLAGRVEIWSRAIYAIQDFPFTGCGLGTFRRVVHLLYPLFLVTPDTDIAHAHNIFLQTALDLGIPGLIAYLALLFVALAICWRSAQDFSAGRMVRVIALGLAGGLVAIHTYGLTDALALGSKPAVAFWFALGLVAGMERIRTTVDIRDGDTEGRHYV